jgi:hypothetical protein
MLFLWKRVYGIDLEGKILRGMPSIKVAVIKLPPTWEADKDRQATDSGTNDRGCLPEMRYETHGTRAAGKYAG